MTVPSLVNIHNQDLVALFEFSRVGSLHSSFATTGLKHPPAALIGPQLTFWPWP